MVAKADMLKLLDWVQELEKIVAYMKAKKQ
jgi:hypothetical protein